MVNFTLAFTLQGGPYAAYWAGICQAVDVSKRKEINLATVTMRTDSNTEISFVGALEKVPPLWSSGQSFWLQIQRSQVRSPALPDFLSSSGSGTGST